MDREKDTILTLSKEKKLGGALLMFRWIRHQSKESSSAMKKGEGYT